VCSLHSHLTYGTFGDVSCLPAAIAGAAQVRIVEAAKERLQKDMRSNSSKNLAAMVSVQA
jgi:hypothetical protein